MTPKEHTRVQVLNSLLAEPIALDQAAELMGVSTRHARRITTAYYREEGAAALAHGHRGGRPVNATPEAVIRRGASGRHSIPGGQLYAPDRTAERAGRHRHRPDHPATHSARRILLDAGLSIPRRRRPPKHRVRRQRMSRAGMLVQLDGSTGGWGTTRIASIKPLPNASGCRK